MRLSLPAASLAWALLSAPAYAVMNVARFENTTATPTPTGPPTSTGSVFSSTDGPFLAAYSFTWSQWIVPTTVGTVHVTIDPAHNTTYRTTIYHTDFSVNGSHGLLHRTDTNAAGTVTGVATILGAPNVTVAYPTSVFVADPSFTWAAVLPITTTGTYIEVIPTTDLLNGAAVLASSGRVITDVGAEGTCCLSTQTLTATATHTPFSSDGPTNTADPSGWLYTLVGWNEIDPYTELAPPAVSSLWSPLQLGLNASYAACTHTYCNDYLPQAGSAPAEALSSQANLLATTTTVLSASPKSSPTAEPENSPTTNSPPATSNAGSSPSQQPAASNSPASQEPAPSPSPSTGNGAEPGNNPTTSPQGEPNPTTSPQGEASPTTTPQGEQSPTTTPQSEGSPQQSPQPEPNQTPSTTVTTSKPVIVVGSSTITQQSSSNFVIGSQTLKPGSTIVVGEGSSTTQVVLRTSGSQTIVQVGQSTTTLQDQPTTITQAVPPPSTSDIVVGSVTVKPAESTSALVVGSQTLTPGSTITLGSGASTTIVALHTSGSQTILQVGTQSTTLTQPLSPQTTPQAIVIGSVTAKPETVASGLVVGSQTLTPGESITLGSGASTTVVALRTSGSETVLQVGTQLTTLAPAATPSDIVLGSVTLSPAGSATELVIGSQTLTPGESITLGSGSSTTVVALRTSGSDTILQVGTSLTTLTPGSGASTTDIGGYVASGLGGGSQLPTGGSNSNATGTGAGQSNDARRSGAFGAWHLVWLAVGAFLV